MTISASDVKQLRDQTNAPMMDCKKALIECNGDMEKAVKWLRERGIMKAASRAHRVAAEGLIASYVHMGGKIGVLVEVNSETDFVARGAEFQTFVKDICLQICSSAPRWISKEDIPENVLNEEKQLYIKQALETGKPQNVCEKIAEGKLNKWYEEVCLLEQVSVKPEHEGKKIKDLLGELTAKCGEKIEIRRFVRWVLGEGIEKKQSNFAEEVAAELAKASGKEA
ncbi:MAG TPA: translation elongation factor Ts [Candidatus Hydrogenedens sp.]|nr:translation elongation factor Ts [Candidatus Hydrogenedens sp.]HOK09831.1 translation elongation factor Ts [Candidatus Hydrogenedens sp.]HOL19488.1 translation elongation factor Ts [Candidatus Hydrogenedens sp.]HPP59408.1 translation elongation factor Ts [Candidatus Hydrogenedens sp.]